MVQVPRRTAFADSALVRLLARWNEAQVRAAAAPTAERLSQWLAWTDAIALSTVLNAPPVRAKAAAGTGVGNAEAACARVRDGLARTIRDDSLFVRALRTQDAEPASVSTAVDFAPYRLRYLARQQAMEAGVGPLRAQLRSALAACTPEMAKLATVDAVMEQALVAREHSLLATVPAMLEQHFKRLQKAVVAAEPAPDAPQVDVDPLGWLDVFHQDIRDLLLAELDFRFQPVDGLLEALRSH